MIPAITAAVVLNNAATTVKMLRRTGRAFLGSGSANKELSLAEKTKQLIKEDKQRAETEATYARLKAEGASPSTIFKHIFKG